MPDHTPLSIGGESGFEFSDGLKCFPYTPNRIGLKPRYDLNENLSDWQAVRKLWLVGFPTPLQNLYACQEGISLVLATSEVSLTSCTEYAIERGVAPLSLDLTVMLVAHTALILALFRSSVDPGDHR